jgi:hypothetical protein
MKDDDHSLSLLGMFFKRKMSVGCLFACLPHRKTVDYFVCVCVLWELGANKRKCQSWDLVISQKQQTTHSIEASSHRANTKILLL